MPRFSQRDGHQKILAPLQHGGSCSKLPQTSSPCPVFHHLCKSFITCVIGDKNSNRLQTIHIHGCEPCPETWNRQLVVFHPRCEKLQHLCFQAPGQTPATVVKTAQLTIQIHYSDITFDSTEPKGLHSRVDFRIPFSSMSRKTKPCKR